MKSKNLKMPLWQDLVYMAFVAIAPIVICCLELFESHSSVFKITFASLGALLVTFIVIKKYVLKSYFSRVQAEILQLEHDYSISVGNDTLIENKWKKLKLICYITNAITVVLAMLLTSLFVTALVDGLIAFKGAVLLILAFVLVGIVFKIICYLASMKK